jgi:phthalate 3,4-dioxygenase ferredoxin reductase subunit
VIGAGFVGAEVAATARALGREVRMVSRGPAPLGRLLPPAVGERIARLHEARGVRTLLGVQVADVEAVADGLLVRLTDGSTLETATAVVGIGSVPNDGWLRGSGLHVDDGVVCDRYGRAAPHVFAVGDVSRWHHRGGGHRRFEHWTNAVEQASCVAHNITHPHRLRAHDPLEYVWSDQYDRRIQIVGRTGPGLSHLIVERPGVDDAFAVLCARPDGVLAGAVTLDWPQALVTCRRAVSDGTSQQEVAVVLGAPRPLERAIPLRATSG